MAEIPASLLYPLLLTLILLGLCLLSAQKYSNRQYPVDNSHLGNFAEIESLNAATSGQSLLNLKISNIYIERDGDPNWQYPWLVSDNQEEQIILAEPFRESKIFITSDDGITPLSSHDNNFEWQIFSLDGQTEQEYSGTNSLDIMFEETGVYYIFVRKFDLAHQAVAHAKVKVHVKYVRREIRSLTDEDLEMTLDTMALLWSVPQEEGMALYGENYLSALQLLKAHLYLAGARECDHIHDGMGFTAHHAAMTVLFERSMQAVNPKVSLPYWDYAMDFQKIADLGGESPNYMDFVNSAVFSAKYFGSTDDETHEIKDGRWAGLTVPTTDSLTDEELETMPSNTFGYMRAPWSSNVNAGYTRTTHMCGVDPTATSFYSPSSCDKFQTLLKLDNLLDYSKYVSYLPHGPVHIILGGAWGCAQAYERLNELFTEDQVYDLTAVSFEMHKQLYRWNLLECEEGKEYCACPDLETMIKTEEGVDEILDKSMFYKTLGLGKDDLTLEQKKLGADVLCNSHLHDGDQIQASSSYAPEFWPIHPTLERAYQYKLLVDPFENDEWPEGTGAFLESSSGECYGHLETDLVLDGYFPLNIGKKEKITNREFMNLLDPSSSVLEYVYDNFEWSYCEASGYSMKI